MTGESPKPPKPIVTVIRDRNMAEKASRPIEDHIVINVLDYDTGDAIATFEGQNIPIPEKGETLYLSADASVTESEGSDGPDIITTNIEAEEYVVTDRKFFYAEADSMIQNEKGSLGGSGTVVILTVEET